MSNDNDLDVQAQKDFNFTQSTRRNLVLEITKKGPLPESKEDSQTLLQAMRDMDAQNIQRMRIKVEEQVGGAMAGMAGMVSAILREVNPAISGFNNQPMEVIETMVKRLPDSVAPVQIVPGELAINPAQGDYHAFISKMKE